MALIGRNQSCHFRPSNKEPEWSSLCNNVFDQYLDNDDIFDVDARQRQRNSSDDSSNIFDFSSSSRQSNHTSATSPIPSWSEASSSRSVETPKAKVPGDFWTKKLRALEQNAANSEAHQRTLRNAKSHPDFLSLGGFPSPPAVPTSSKYQPASAPRQRSRVSANGNRTPSRRSVTNSRSVSRGRPSGVTKPPASDAANPYATIRRSNASPAKMMNPSRYRAGFKDVWAERIEHSPKKYELRVPAACPDSPPPSGRSIQDSFAVFGPPLAYAGLPGCDDQISPLTNTFHQVARIQTPIASPLLDSGSHTGRSYFDLPLLLSSNTYKTQAHTVPQDDTAPLYANSRALVDINRDFDFGFSTAAAEDTWSAEPYTEPFPDPYSTSLARGSDPFHHLVALPDPNTKHLGLGISCDPNTIAPHATLNPRATYIAPETSPPRHAHQPPFPAGLPLTPTTPTHHHDTTKSCRSPSPGTEPRPRRPARYHRRSKSAAASAPRDGGFVNFTPEDGTRILNGVAPSGSSKTKARREKEAAEKRRRLSQAAVRAVIEAGGDVGRLQQAGLIGVGE